MREATRTRFFHNKAKCTSGPLMSRPTERTFPRPDGTVDWLWSTRAFTWCYNWVWNEKEDTYWGGFEKAQLFKMRDIEQQFPPWDQDVRERERIIPGDSVVSTVSSVIPLGLSPHHSSLSISRWKINNLFRQASSHIKSRLKKDLFSFTRSLPPFFSEHHYHSPSVSSLLAHSHLESLAHNPSFFLRHMVEVMEGCFWNIFQYRLLNVICSIFSTVCIALLVCLRCFRPDHVSDAESRAQSQHTKLDSLSSFRTILVGGEKIYELTGQI